jgi:DNA-binding PadR family transcriptional regulator
MLRAQLIEETASTTTTVTRRPRIVYQLTDAGLALELTAKGTKYYKDKDLN